MPTLEWIGKDKVINHHQNVPFRVLERKYSYDQSGLHNEDISSKNMIIHGDNLEALKALLPQYEGKINCIYIDPPYNTGNEKWVYNDNVNDPKIKKWLGDVVGKEGEDLSRHDKWLCMIYPRLKLLHKLLADNGLIFVSINDAEIANLKLIMNEIFGESNFRGQIARATGTPTGQGNEIISNEIDYMLVYAKSSKALFNGLPFSEKDAKIYNKKDSYGRYLVRPLRKTGGEDHREDRPSMYFPVIAPDGTEIYPIGPSGYESRWRCSLDGYNKLLEENKIEWKKDSAGWKVYQKFYLEGRTKQVSNLWVDIEGNKKASLTLKNIFGKKVFDFPKPVELIENVITVAADSDSIILDSFAGSGTTAHAVLNLNKQDGGNRKFILIEMEDYADSITAERVKHVINGYGKGKNVVDGTGGDFSFYNLGEVMIFPDGNLNENVNVNKIREYIYYMETKEELPIYEKSDNKYYLGTNRDTAYYFYYEKNQVTTLDHAFLSRIGEKTDEYIIYADLCTLSDREQKRYNITFKKIPRDIARL